jgi:hypothetical protein
LPRVRCRASLLRGYSKRSDTLGDPFDTFCLISKLPWNWRSTMPDQEILERTHQDAREGKSPSTQAGEFVREEMHHIREGKHGARSSKQAIAIGLSKARRAGVKLAPPRRGAASAKTVKQADRDSRKGQRHSRRRPSGKRSRAITRALQREGHRAASRKSLSRQARSTARQRSSAARHRSAMKAVQAKGRKGRSRAARKAGHARYSRRSS